MMYVYTPNVRCLIWTERTQDWFTLIARDCWVRSLTVQFILRWSTRADYFHLKMCGYRKTIRQTKVEDVMSRISWRAGTAIELHIASPSAAGVVAFGSWPDAATPAMRPLRLGARHPSCYVMADLGSKKNGSFWSTWDDHGFLWIFMDYHGLSWIFLWIIMDFFVDYHGFLWIIMDCHGLSWIFMDFDKKLSSTGDLNGLVASPPIPRRQIQQTKAGAPRVRGRIGFIAPKFRGALKMSRAHGIPQVSWRIIWNNQLPWILIDFWVLQGENLEVRVMFGFGSKSK